MSTPHTPSLRHRLFQLAWPVLIAQLAVMANSVIDTLMAGRLSALDLAAVGIGASIYATVAVTAVGVLFALSPIVAHHQGAGRHREIGSDVRQSVWLALTLAALTMALLLHPDVFLRFSRLTPEVEALVRSYLVGAAWAVPAALVFRVFHGFTTGIGRPRPVMVFNLLGLAMKVPLNWVFMYGGLGVQAMGGAGAGWSTAISAWIVASTAWWWCRRENSYAHYGVFGGFEWPRWPLLKELLRLGVPTGATFMVDVTAFTFMALFIARLGAETSAAHQVAASIAVFVFMVPMALGNATGVLVGQALGAGNPVLARRAGLLGLGVATLIAVVIGLFIFLSRQWLAALYSSDATVAALAATLLALVALYHVADAVQAVMAQVLRGYKRATVPMAIYALALWGIGLGGGYLLGLTDSLGAARGAAGFWLAACVSLVAAASGVIAYFLHVSSATEASQR